MSAKISDKELAALERLTQFNRDMDGLRDSARRYTERTMNDIREITQSDSYHSINSKLMRGETVYTRHLIGGINYNTYFYMNGSDVIIRIPCYSRDIAFDVAKNLANPPGGVV